MTQRQLDTTGFSLKRKFRCQSTQTSYQNKDLLHIQLDVNKTARIYYSTTYKNNVLCLNCGNSKNFLFTKQMWTDFRKYFQEINDHFDDGNPVRHAIHSSVLHDDCRPFSKR